MLGAGRRQTSNDPTSLSLKVLISASSLQSVVNLVDVRGLEPLTPCLQSRWDLS